MKQAKLSMVIIALVLCGYGIQAPFHLTDPPTEPTIDRSVRGAETLGDMGPPPYEYIRIRGEAVPNWVPKHLRRAPSGAGPLNWTVLGPKPIVSEFWSGNDDASGRVVSLAPHPTDDDICYIASASGGIWKTVDGGLNWTPLTDELSNLNHGVVTLDPSNSNTVYAGTGEYTTGSTGDGLFKSTDAGATWIKIATKEQTSFRYSGLIIDPTNPLIIHTSGSGGYDRSINGGTNWSQFVSGAMSSMVMSPNNSQVLYLGDHNDGVRKSINGGATWTLLGGGLPAAGTIQRIVLAMSASAGPLDTIYAACIFNADLEGLYRTTDSGTTWTKLVNTPDFPSPQGWYDVFVGVDPTNANTVYCGGVFPSYAVAGVIKTTDGGINWNDITVSGISGQLHPDQHAVAFGPTGIVWIGNDGGVWKSTDAGASWINTNNTLNITQNYSLAVNPLNPDIMMSGTQDNGTIERQAAIDDWPQIRAGDGGYLVYDFNFPTRRYTTYVYLSIARQVGTSSTNITGPWSGDSRNFIAPMVMDPNDASTLLGGTNRIWRTTNADTTASWTAISTSDGNNINAIAVATGASDTIYYGTRAGNVYNTTNASTWTNRSAGLPSGQVADIVVDPTDATHAFVSYHNTSGSRILETTNFGVSWSNVTGNLPVGISARALAVDWRFTTPGLYIGSGVGVYSSSDGGFNWIKDGVDLPNVNIGDLVIDEPRGVIYAGTYGRGAWRSDLPNPLGTPGCPADCSGSGGIPDGTVDVDDLLALLAAWGTSDPPDGLCDFEPQPIPNGIVDVEDLLTLLAAWGDCPPPNDDLVDAQPVGIGQYAFDNSGASTDGPADCPGMASDIWYCLTAPCTGNLNVSLCGSTFDTVLAVYDACDGSGLLMDCNDDFCGPQSEVTVPVSAGQSYLIRVGGFSGAQGAGTMDISCTALDDCVNAVVISSGQTAFSTIGATTDGPAHAVCVTSGDGGQTYQDTWFLWTAPAFGNLTLTTCNLVDYDSDIVIYSNTDCGNLQFMACNDDYALATCGTSLFHSQIDNLFVNGGQTYLIRVGGWNDGDVGTGFLDVIFTPLSHGPGQTPAPQKLQIPRPIQKKKAPREERTPEHS